MRKNLLLLTIVLLPLCFALTDSTENQPEILTEDKQGILDEPLMDNQALGFVCQGELKILAPEDMRKSSFLTLFSTRMQETMAPMEVDLQPFEGQFVTISWQVGDGATFWGVSVAPVYQDDPLELPLELP